MRQDRVPISEDVILQKLSEDLRFYSLWMPSDSMSYAMQVRLKSPLVGSIDTYHDGSCLDEVFVASMEYFVRAGAPLFKDAKVLPRYTDVLKAELGKGSLRETLGCRVACGDEKYRSFVSKTRILLL